MAEFAALLARRVGSDARVTWSTDRTEVLKRADTVIVSAEVDRLAAWEADWEIPHRYGIGHTLGENRGPAGLSHTLRTAPLVVAIARDIERMAPDAVMFIMTNPEDRLAYAVRAYTSVDAIGYCDGLWDFRDHVLGPPWTCAGKTSTSMGRESTTRYGSGPS
jgi:alpha-galactosidase